MGEKDEGNPVWNHPLDLHFYASAIQGWPHVLLEVFTLNAHGIREICQCGEGEGKREEGRKGAEGRFRWIWLFVSADSTRRTRVGSEYLETQWVGEGGVPWWAWGDGGGRELVLLTGMNNSILSWRQT